MWGDSPLTDRDRLTADNAGQTRDVGKSEWIGIWIAGGPVDLHMNYIWTCGFVCE